MKIPEPPVNGHTTASFSPGESPVISQPTAYLMLSALKLVCRMLDEYGPGILGTLEGHVRSAMLRGEREASNR